MGCPLSPEMASKTCARSSPMSVLPAADHPPSRRNSPPCGAHRMLTVGIDYVSQIFQRECRGEPCGIDDVAEHHRQVALFAGQPPCSTLERFGCRRSARERRRAEGIDGGTQFLAIAERQAELPEIGIG